MVQFLNATQTLGEIQSIISQAANGSTIVMISPWVKVHDLILSRLNDAGANRNVKITVICREADLKPNERISLERIPNLTLLSAEHLHAKCFYNEQCMVIGSLNLYESTTGVNHEMGVLLRNDLESDQEAFQAAKSEAQYIMRDAHNNRQQKLEPNPKNIPSKTSKTQYTSKIETGTGNKFVRDIQTPALPNKPAVLKNTLKSIEPSQTSSIPCCKACGGKRLKVLGGKYGYYYKCDNCNKNTPIEQSCWKCGKKLKVRKSANNFFFDCASCNMSALFYKNPT